MTQHTRRAGSRSGGFSFVELLVTIIIAGIAFAAMVPLFVQAQKQTSADKMRVVAANVAQDRLEKVRQVDYELLTQANLASGSFYFGQFGTTWSQQTASGTKQFAVSYRVVEDTVKATKTVTVNVDWVGPPYPHKTVSMTTVVYRQWQGPTLSWRFTPDADPVGAGTLTITVTIDPSDIDPMKPVTVGDRTLMGRVDFMIEPVDGAPLPVHSVTYAQSTAGGSQYVYNWQVPSVNGSLDGNYWIRAVAYTANGFMGNTLSTFRLVETGPPQPVTNLTAAAGYGNVALSWVLSTSRDVDHYVIERRNLDTGEEKQVVAASVPPSSVGYFDDDEGVGLPTGIHEYKVTAVDHAGQQAATSVTVQIYNNAAEAPPALAISLTGTVSGSAVTLSWVASPSIYITNYFIYKDGSHYATVGANVLTHVVDQGWDTTARYQVKAVNAGVPSDTFTTLGLLGAGCTAVTVDGVQWVQATTNPQYFQLDITNSMRQGNTRYVLSSLKLEKLVGGAWEVVNTPDGQPQFTNVAFDATVSWTQLTPGQYRWTWASAGGNGTAGATYTGVNTIETATVRR